MHEKNKHFRGKSLKPHIEKINQLVEELDLVTLLDYGSGKGKYIHRILADVTPYDPAYEPYSELPKCQFDGVICTDVMEHIPEEEIDENLERIFNYARDFVFFNISTKPAEKKLPNGENTHCTLKPEDWWIGRIIGKRDELGTTQNISINFD